MKQEKENVESKQDFKEVFRRLVRRVIEKSRCEKVLAAISDLKRDREAFEKLCFQFIEDEESALYRYRGLRIFQLCNIYVILGYLERFNGIAVTVSSYKLSGCTYVEYGKTADSL